MKRIIAMVIAISVMLTLAACSGKKNNVNDKNTQPPADEAPTTDEVKTDVPETDAPTTDQPDDGGETADSAALDILNAIYAKYAEDEKFPVGGGDSDHFVDGAPGNYDLAAADMIDSMLGMPAAEAEKLTSAASLMHMMNANTFTSAAFTTDGDIDALAKAYEDNIAKKQWLCGFPETLLIMKGDGCIITAFGADDLIQVFKTHALEAVEGLSVVTEKPVEFGGEGQFEVPAM